MGILKIEPINVREIGVRSVPNISSFTNNMPPPIIPYSPPVTVDIGTPIVNMPGCVEAHPDGSPQLAKDDPKGARTYCDAQTPSYNAMDYKPEEMVITQVSQEQPPATKEPTEAESQEQEPPPSEVPDTPQAEVPAVPKQEEKEEICPYYAELLVSDPRCIEPTFVDKYFPPMEVLTATTTIAVVGTSSAIFAKPIADLLLKVVKPIVKKLITKVKKMLGKKQKPQGVRERRLAQRELNRAILELRRAMK